MAAIFRAGRVSAADSKWTGEEPIWAGWEKWPIEQFMKTRMRMLNFYGYYLGEADLKPEVLAYMKGRYSKEDIALISGSRNVLPLTVGKLVRAMNKGMPSLHPKAQAYFENLPFANDDPENPPIAKCDHMVIAKELNAALGVLRASKDPSSTDAPKKPVTKIPPMDLLKTKVDREIISKLDEMLDDWIMKWQDTRVEGLSLTSYIRDGNIPGAGCKFIADWLNKQLAEYQGALDKTCPQLVEGYEHMSKPAIRNRIMLLETMLGEVTKVSAAAKGARKPRVKKTKDATKQVAKVQYQESSEVYRVTSIAPARIPGAQRLYVFNTKYRKLFVYYAASAAGFEVKGTSLKNYDEKLSYAITLRKPQGTLDMIVSSAPKMIDKTLDAMLSKKGKANGRLNPQSVLLKAVETRV